MGAVVPLKLVNKVPCCEIVGARLPELSALPLLPSVFECDNIEPTVSSDLGLSRTDWPDCWLCSSLQVVPQGWCDKDRPAKQRQFS